jgi:hypothetical protein
MFTKAHISVPCIDTCDYFGTFVKSNDFPEIKLNLSHLTVGNRSSIDNGVIFNLLPGSNLASN